MAHDRDINDRIRSEAQAAIAFTYGPSPHFGQLGGSTGHAYLHELSRAGVATGYTMYLGNGKTNVSSTGAAETFITEQLGGTIA